MPFKFNETLWKLGQKIEDDTLPLINKHYECDFKRNENDIFDCIKHHCIPITDLTEIN